MKVVIPTCPACGKDAVKAEPRTGGQWYACECPSGHIWDYAIIESLLKMARGEEL